MFAEMGDGEAAAAATASAANGYSAAVAGSRFRRPTTGTATMGHTYWHHI